MPGYKFCAKCGDEKPVSDYHNNGKHCYCKPCNSAIRAEWYAKNKARARATIRAYQEANPDWVRAMGRLTAAAYRARKNGAIVDGVMVTASAIRLRWSMWGDKCYLCHAAATETDHVIPIKSGGLHVPANLRPICRSCNATKNASNWRQYLVGAN